LFRQVKVSKKKATPVPLNPSVLAQRWYGCGTRPTKLWAQTVLAVLPSLCSSLRRDKEGKKIMRIYTIVA